MRVTIKVNERYPAPDTYFIHLFHKYLSKVGIGVGYLVRQTAAASFFNLFSTDLNLKSPGKAERKFGNQMDKTKAVLGRKTIYN